jgi:hypothetical protein
VATFFEGNLENFLAFSPRGGGGVFGLLSHAGKSDSSRDGS